MALEIERKFLIKNDLWRQQAVSSSRIVQGYLTASGTTVRIRLRDDQAFLTIKGKANGIIRSEFEYPVPPEEAQEMLCSVLDCNDTVKPFTPYMHHYVVEAFIKLGIGREIFDGTQVVANGEVSTGLYTRVGHFLIVEHILRPPSDIHGRSRQAF